MLVQQTACLDNLFIGFIIDFNGGDSFLYISQDHVEVLIIRLRSHRLYVVLN